MIGLERAALLEELAGACPQAAVTGYVPEELLAPAIVLTPAEDYLTHDEANRYDEATLNLDLYVLVDLVGNEQAAEDLDQLLDQLLPILTGSRWSLNRMSRPGPFHTTSWLAHGVQLALSTETPLP